MSQKELAALVATRTSRKRTVPSSTSPMTTRSEPRSIIEIHISNDAASTKRACREVEKPSSRAEQQLPQEEESQGQVPPLTEEEQQRHNEFRTNGSIFLQDLPCFKLQQTQPPPGSSPIPKCRECRRRNLATKEGETSAVSDVYCRFYEFRRLQFNEKGELGVVGFPNPYSEPSPEDIAIWQPDKNTAPTSGYMDIQVCRYILLHAGDQFCYLWRQEAEALRLHQNPDGTIAWKKAVKGTREICDVCDTTLFNYHWTCSKCGFGVCLDCFKDRKEGQRLRRAENAAQKGCDEYHWLLCTDPSGPQEHALTELNLDYKLFSINKHLGYKPGWHLLDKQFLARTQTCAS